MSNSKKEYTVLECSVIRFNNEDIVTTSGASANQAKLSAADLNAASKSGDLSFTDLFGL